MIITDKHMNRAGKIILVIIACLAFVYSTSSYSQERKLGYATPTEDIYGTFVSFDNEQILYMYFSDEGDTFKRKSGDIIVEGSFTVEDDYLYVQKYNEEYRLLFFLKGIHLIVMKPENEGPGQAWLFTKRSSYTDKDY